MMLKNANIRYKISNFSITKMHINILILNLSAKDRNLIFLQMWSCYVAHTFLKLLCSRDLPHSAFIVAEAAGMCH